MKLLFDQGVPVPLRLSLAGPEVSTAYEPLPKSYSVTLSLSKRLAGNAFCRG
jgi:hypothetical protein